MSKLRSRMGRTARERVQSGYSVAAWAETFVTSVAAVEKTSFGGARRLAVLLRGPFPTRFTFACDGWAACHRSRSAVGLTATATTTTRPVQIIPEYAHDVDDRQGTGSPGGAADVPAPGMAVGADRPGRLVASRTLGCDLARPRGPSPRTSGATRAGSRRSSRGRIESSTGSIFPKVRSTSSTTSCPTTAPCGDSGFAGARAATRASVPRFSRRSACRPFIPSPWVSRESESSSSRTT